MRLILLTLFAITTLLGQFKTASAGAPPADVAALAPTLAKDGIKVLKEDGSVLCELWLVAAEPTGGASEQNATWSAAPQGVLLGAIRFPARHSDRRGQQIKPGVYSMRYGLFPMNGDHQGVEPQRDFMVLSPAAADTNAAAKPAFDALMNMSRKASGTPHPLVLSFWKEDSKVPTGVEAVGDDQVLHGQVGNTTISVILVGKTAH